MANIRVLATGSRYIKCDLANLDTNWSSGDRRVIWYLNDTNMGGVDLPIKVYSGGEFTFSNLTPNTQYKIDVEIIWKNGTYWQILVAKGVIATFYKTTLPVIGEFLWTYTGVNSDGLVVQGTRKNSSYNLFLATSEWNRLVENVRAKLTRRGMYYEEVYLLNSATLVSGEYFSATKFNLVRFAIGSLASTGLGNKVAGDEIKSDELNVLMDSINTVVVD